MTSVKAVHFLSCPCPLGGLLSHPQPFFWLCNSNVQTADSATTDGVDQFHSCVQRPRDSMAVLFPRSLSQGKNPFGPESGETQQLSVLHSSISVKAFKRAVFAERLVASLAFSSCLVFIQFHRRRSLSQIVTSVISAA